MPVMFGTAPNQAPLNSDLGEMAYQSADAVTIGSLSLGLKTVTAAYSMDRTDHTVLVDATAGAVTVTLPPVAPGFVVCVKKIDASANAVTVARASTSLIDGATTKALAAQWSSIRLQSDGTNWFVV